MKRDRLWPHITALTLLLFGCSGPGPGSEPFEVRVTGDELLGVGQAGRLQAEVIFREGPEDVEVEWNLSSGPGEVSFSPSRGMETTVELDEPGTYRIASIARGSRHTARAEIEVTAVEPGASPVERLEYVATVDTGYRNGLPLPIRSIDPAGLVFHPSSDTFLIVDSEINEVEPVYTEVAANAFRTPRAMNAVTESWDLLAESLDTDQPNDEPTGIAFCDGHFFVTNDDSNGIYRYSLEDGNLTLVDFTSIQNHSRDPEGIACDPIGNELYVISGDDSVLLAYRFGDGLELIRSIDFTSWNEEVQPGAPEGIAFDAVNRHLFIVSDPDRVIYELTYMGEFVNAYDLDSLEVPAVDPQGLTIAPSSRDGSEQSLFIADGGVDNGADPDERDGYIHELEIARQ